MIHPDSPRTLDIEYNEETFIISILSLIPLDMRFAAEKDIRLMLDERGKAHRPEEKPLQQWTEAGEAAFEKWWQTWRQQNSYPNTQRMRDAARSVYESLTSGSIDTMIEQLREQGHLSPPLASVAKIKRYEPYVYGDGSLEWDERSDGEWVKWSDVKPMLSSPFPSIGISDMLGTI